LGQAFLILAVLAVVGLGVWLHLEAERKRLAALSAWCAAEGWGFDESELRSPDHPYDLFQRGHSRYLRWTATKLCPEATPGLAAAELRLFEYHYAVTRHTGKHTHTDHYHFTCALVDPGLRLGAVALRREGWGDKLAQAIGFEDIDLEDPEFSRRFVVQARERRDAYELLDGAMMRYPCARPATALETRGRELFACVEERASRETFHALSAFLLGFLAQLPRPLVNAERARLGLAPELEAGNASRSSRGALERPADPRST
jgi:hypothetical protein